MTDSTQTPDPKAPRGMSRFFRTVREITYGMAAHDMTRAAPTHAARERCNRCDLLGFTTACRAEEESRDFPRHGFPPKP